ncbi:hypothetical protein AB0L34_11020 [Micromonospora sp. NPDC052213]|uniref:hypothetical protein n=1 Tax=Micromonospora sp. NPDC052213 TaxID=3155812 RepID=UPI003441259B
MRNGGGRYRHRGRYRGARGRGSRPGFYNPFGGYPITGTWQEHLNRGSLGGIDYGMPVGTRLPAAGGGVVTNDPNNGTGGQRNQNSLQPIT